MTKGTIETISVTISSRFFFIKKKLARFVEDLSMPYLGYSYSPRERCAQYQVRDIHEMFVIREVSTKPMRISNIQGNIDVRVFWDYLLIPLKPLNLPNLRKL